MDDLFVQAERMEFRCAFCNKSQDQLEQLIAGPNRVYICNECVELCNLILNEQKELERQRRLASGEKEADNSPRHDN